MPTDWLLDRVRKRIAFDIVKHQLEGYDYLEKRIDEIINAMSPLELLEAISWAFDELVNEAETSD